VYPRRARLVTRPTRGLMHVWPSLLHGAGDPSAARGPHQSGSRWQRRKSGTAGICLTLIGFESSAWRSRRSRARRSRGRRAHQVTTTVPAQWIPLLPCPRARRRAGDPATGRGAGADYRRGPEPPDQVEPRTAVRREGLNLDDAQSYFVNEEVLRVGSNVTQSYQRTRWRGGRTPAWVGVRRQTDPGGGLEGPAVRSARKRPTRGVSRSRAVPARATALGEVALSSEITRVARPTCASCARGQYFP
jgi:hypothetical protein